MHMCHMMCWRTTSRPGCVPSAACCQPIAAPASELSMHCHLQGCSMPIALLQLGLAASSQVLPDRLLFGHGACSGSWQLAGLGAVAINMLGAALSLLLDLHSRRHFLRAAG